MNGSVWKVIEPYLSALAHA